MPDLEASSNSAEQEIGAVRAPASLRQPEQAQRPDHGLTVGYHEIGTVDLSPERGVVPRLHHHVDVRRADHTTPTVRPPGMDELGCRGKLDAIHGQAEDAGAVEIRRRALAEGPTFWRRMAAHAV